MSPVRAGLAFAMALLTGSSPVSIPRIDPGNIDRSVDPCVDFDAFANGPWRAQNPIPAGNQRWSLRMAARETNREQLKAILEDLAARPARPRGRDAQLLGDFYAACLNEPAIEAAGIAPLTPWLEEIAAVEDARGIQRTIRRLHDLAVHAPFGVTASSDYHDPERVVMNVVAGGLGLPGRDYYLGREPRFVEARETYRAHVSSLLKLGGLPAEAATSAADEIVALETRLAEASLAPEAAADQAATAHKVAFARLKEMAGQIDWETYLVEAALPRIDVNVAEPAFVDRLNRELGTTSLSTWKAYLTFHLLESASPWLTAPTSAQTATKPRAMRCVELTEALLGEPLGREYAARYFPPAAKAKVQEMIRTMLAVLKDDVRALTWMSDAAKKEAIAKLATYEAKVGYPDTWTSHEALVIRRDSFLENFAAARRFGVDISRRHIGQRSARAIWQLPPTAPAAYIDVQLNLIALPGGFLQPWAFDLAASNAVNYGAIGAGIAHDLTHAIDALGATFDAAGAPRKWWSQADRDVFQKISQCTADQYDRYAIEPGVHVQGKQVLGEALGDLAGVRLAYRALERSMQTNPVPRVDGLSAEQQFFIAWGQFRGAAETLEQQRQMAAGPHPPARYRVIGPLSNMTEFERAFSCKPGSAMARPAGQRCSVW